MIIHYLKVAFRNLWKYKSQTLISVIGLAVGFTCFALATLWIRYDMSYDSFHKNADRMYCVYEATVFGKSLYTQYSLAAYMKKTFPEISHATTIQHYETKILLEGLESPVDVDVVNIDTTFLSMYDVKILEGSIDFMIPYSRKLAITQEKALQLFGDESPIGKVINGGSTICAVVTGLPKRSNHPFDILSPFSSEYFLREWGDANGNTLIKLEPAVNVEAFKKKLYEHIMPDNSGVDKLSIIPLTKVRHNEPLMQGKVKFQHVLIIAGAGILVILCTLFNYFTLFISRFRMRQKELALRMVYGASGRSLLALLSVEFIISLIVAVFAGFYLMEILFPGFRTFSEIKLDRYSIYLEALIYIGIVMLISLLIFMVILVIFRRRSLSGIIHRNNKNLFRKISVIVQLIISIGFIFCTTIIIKQMYYLHNTDLGFAFKNRGAVFIFNGGADENVLENRIKQMPEIIETVAGLTPLIPYGYFTSANSIPEWDGSSIGADPINMQSVNFSEQYADFYELELIEGEMLNENEDTRYVLINESAVKAFGWTEPVGKSFNNHYVVKGVIKNIYSFAPTIAAKPQYYSRLDETAKEQRKIMCVIIFKHKEGAWNVCKEKIEQIIKEIYPGVYTNIYNTEEEYDKFLKSENILLKILSFISLVCIIICVFGFVSLVSLTCEERRKEIAIRKINGATVKDILDIFFKEYIVLLAVGAVIAFPLGYLIMKRWLEDYVVQTPISAWIYALILLMLILAIVLCVGWKVYKTSRENPAEVVKKN
jgi:ABC-type antimicrobial peptide transport system permease subunit